MTRARRGFTIIELMIVLVIIAIIVAITIPILLSSRLSANEAAAVSSLRTINSAQSQFQAAARADADVDGTGEYGFFVELSGAAPPRGGARPILPPPLARSFGNLTNDGRVQRSGYYFAVGLPIAGGHVREVDASGSLSGAPDPDLSESTWAVYAWPVDHGFSGVRTFFVNQTGVVVFAVDTAYEGSGGGTLQAGAAFLGATPGPTITGRIAVGTVASDGNLWKALN